MMAAVEMRKSAVTEITEHVFVYPTCVYVWTVYYGPLSEDSPVTDVTYFVADLFFTEEDAEKRRLTYNEVWREAFTITRIRHEVS
jgi:hypothetical protein